MNMVITLLGVIFLGLAAAGAFLPLLPTVPFVLLAAACFAKSSPRFHAWLLNNPTFGPMIHHWQQSRSMPKKTKRVAIASIIATGAVSFYFIELMVVKAALVVMLCIPLIIILRLPNSEDLAPAVSEASSADQL